MLGGLSRRPARLATCKEAGVPFAYVSGGRLVAGADEYDRLRLVAILRALKSMDCAAFAPSASETRLGANALAATAGVPLAGDDGAVDFPGGARVLLTDLDAGAARALAKTAAPATLVLYAAGVVEPRDADVTSGPVAVAPYPAKGEFVGVARLVGDAWTIEYRPVLHDLPEDPTIVAQRRAHLAEMKSAGLVALGAKSARFSVGDVARGRGFVGSDGCAACHADAARVWTASKHAHAMASLAATGDDVDPGCVRCHVVAYGTGDAFLDATMTPQFASIGCEACHDGRAGHAEERRATPVPATKRPPAGASVCAGCHDSEHDPGFDFATRWPRIEHGAR